MTHSNSLPTTKRSNEQIQQSLAVVYSSQAVIFLFFALGVYLAITTGSWQSYVFIALAIQAEIFGAVDIVSLRRGRTENSGLFSLTGNLIAGAVAPYFFVSLGYVGVAYILVNAFFNIRYVLSKRFWRLAIITSGVALLSSLSAELINPAWRQVSSVMVTVSPIFTAILGIVFIVNIVRQTWGGSLRAKLIIAFFATTLVPLVIVAFLNDRSTRTALTTDANQALLSAASLTAAQLDTFVTDNLNTIRTQASLPDFSVYLSLPADQRVGADDEIIAILATYSRQNSIYISSVALYEPNGITLVDTFAADIGTDKSSRSWFQQAIEAGVPYASDVEFSQTTGEASIYFAAPVRDTGGKIIGLLRTRYNASILQDFIYTNNGLVGSTSFPVLIDNNYVRLAHGKDSTLIFKSLVKLDAATVSELQSQRRLPPGSAAELGTDLVDYQASLINVDAQPFFAGTLSSGADQQAATVRTKTQPWLVTFVQAQSEFLGPINAQARNNIILTIVASLAVSVFGVFLAQTLSGPITRLTQTAEKIAGGDITVQAQVETGDEIGTLAGTFNRMTQQLRDFIATLESRVAERTRNLELAGEVGRTVSQVRALDVMLKEAAELIRTQFDLYYVQVYLANPSQTYITLQAGTGQVGAELLGRNHRLPFNTGSINGRAAVEKKSVVISDTTTSATFKPNPLLPDTRSEMAVPLLIGEKVVGVLDMQSREAGKLDKDILAAFEAMAGQLAIAIQNATFLAETEQARAVVEAQAQRLSRANWVDYQDAIHQPEETGFVFEQNKIISMTPVEQSQSQTNVNALTAPIAVTGESLGNLVVEMEGESPISRTSELVNTVARQIAQQIEALRLLDSAERYRFEAEASSRRLTREGWKDYAANTNENMSYFYDQKEVRPYDNESKQEEGVSLPLKVRDETVGRMVVQGLDTSDSEAMSLANAVAERLGAHIEGLRLSQQTENALASTQRQAQREQALRQITSVVRGSTDPAVILRSAVRELGTLLGRKTIIRMATTNETPAKPDSAATSASGSDSTVESPNADGGNV